MTENGFNGGSKTRKTFSTRNSGIGRTFPAIGLLTMNEASKLEAKAWYLASAVLSEEWSLVERVSTVYGDGFKMHLPEAQPNFVRTLIAANDQ